MQHLQNLQEQFRNLMQHLQNLPEQFRNLPEQFKILQKHLQNLMEHIRILMEYFRISHGDIRNLQTVFASLHDVCPIAVIKNLEENLQGLNVATAQKNLEGLFSG